MPSIVEIITRAVQGAEKPLDERSVSAFYNQQPPQEGNLPLRLLTDFSIFTRDEDGIEEPARLEELQNGTFQHACIVEFCPNCAVPVKGPCLCLP